MLEPPPLPEIPEPEPELKQYPDPELDDEPYVQTYVEKGFIEYRTLHEQKSLLLNTVLKRGRPGLLKSKRITLKDAEEICLVKLRSGNQ